MHACMQSINQSTNQPAFLVVIVTPWPVRPSSVSTYRKYKIGRAAHLYHFEKSIVATIENKLCVSLTLPVCRAVRSNVRVVYCFFYR